MMEYWSDGVLQESEPITPLFQHSIPPLLHHSNLSFVYDSSNDETISAQDFFYEGH